jgi:hypothetical protein
MSSILSLSCPSVRLHKCVFLSLRFKATNFLIHKHLSHISPNNGTPGCVRWPCSNFKTIYIGRVIEGMVNTGGVMVLVIIRKWLIWTAVCLWTVAGRELFRCTDMKITLNGNTVNYFVNTNSTFKLQILNTSQLASENPTAELSALRISCATIACRSAELICLCALAAPSEIRASDSSRKFVHHF